MPLRRNRENGSDSRERIGGMSFPPPLEGTAAALQTGDQAASEAWVPGHLAQVGPEVFTSRRDQRGLYSFPSPDW